MDPFELEEIVADLSLDDEPLPALEINDDTLALKKLRVKNCLVGKVLTTRVVNREAFLNGMARLWSYERNLVIESLGRNRFVFSFASM